LALIAGGLSTAAMLMGAEALAWLHGHSVDFLAVDAYGTLHSSNTDGVA
jgi:hypothetical protein